MAPPRRRAEGGPARRATWAGWLAGLALAAGLAIGLQAAMHLPTAERVWLGQGVSGYLRARSGGELAVFGPAAGGWLRAAAPVWAAGLWPKVGVALVALALGMHGFSLGMALGAASALGPAGFGGAVLAVLPGNVLAVPTLSWLGARAASMSAARRGGIRPVPAGYVWLGVAVLGGVTLSSACEAALAPLLLRAAGIVPHLG